MNNNLLPKIIQIKENLYIAKFELMKLLPATYIVNKALKEGLIDPNLPIVETSSGTFALSLAKVCKQLGLSFHIIGDSAIDKELEIKLNQYGGVVQILSDVITNSKPQEIRLQALREFLAEAPGSYWTRQYDNPWHQNAYSTFAEFLQDKLGDSITLVAATGSGGSACGTIKALRNSNPNNRLIGVDTFGSILFGLKNGPRLLRGLGNSIMPKNLEHNCFDEVHWVSANDAFAFTNKLYEKYFLACGPTTGATYQVAEWQARSHPDQVVVFVSADTADRYKETVYSSSWLNEKKLNMTISHLPREVKSLCEVNPRWSYIQWGRKSLKEMLDTKEVSFV